MFENLMREKFIEKKLFVENNSKVTRVKEETDLLNIVKDIKWNTNFDYIDGSLTIRVGGVC